MSTGLGICISVQKAAPETICFFASTHLIQCWFDVRRIPIDLKRRFQGWNTFSATFSSALWATCTGFRCQAREACCRQCITDVSSINCMCETWRSYEDHDRSWFIMIQGMSHISRYGSPSRYLSDLGSARSDRSDSSAAGAALLAFHELEATADKHGKQLHGKQTTGFQWGTWCYSNEIGMASQSEDLKSMTWFHEEICGVRRFQGTCSRHRLVWPKSSCFLSLSNVETPILGYRYVRLTFAGWPDARVLGIQIGCPP